jgi:hypothetical protein
LSLTSARLSTSTHRSVKKFVQKNGVDRISDSDISTF